MKKGGKLSVGQRSRFVKTPFLTKCDYMLFLQPVTTYVERVAGELDRQCVAYIIGVTVRARTSQRAQAIARMLLFLARRRRHYQNGCEVSIPSNFGQCNGRGHPNLGINEKLRHCARNMRQDSSPNTAEELQAWVKAQLSAMPENTWGSAKNLRRKILQGIPMPPAFRFNFCNVAERKAD